MNRLALALVPVVAACGDSSTYLIVTVSARPTVHAVATLDVTQATGGTSRTDSLPLGSHVLPATFSINTTSRAGDLALTINAKADDGSLVGLGSAATTLDAPAAEVLLDPTDFVVNTDFAMDEFLTTDFETVGYQLSATASDTWTAVYRNTCTDTCNVFARTFGADALPVKTAAAAGTNAYQVTSTTTKSGAFPATAAQGAASVAVWDFSDTVGMGVGVACRGIDATGALTAGQRSIATDTADTATVAPLANGNFAVSWQILTPSAAIHSIIAKPDCTTVQASPFVVTSAAGTMDGPHRSSVAANGTALLYAWITDHTARVRPASTAGVFAQAETTFAAPPTGEFASEVRVAPMADGFAVAIRYYSSTSGMPGQIYLARASTTGLIMGAPILISDKTGSDFSTGLQGFGIATRASDGMTLIVWTQCDDGAADSCAGRLDVYGRLIGATGGPLGEPFVIPTTTVGDQTAPSVVALSNAFVVAWTDASKVAPDTDGTSVRARVIYP